MYNKILVPLDGSELAECALEHVKAVATGCGTAEVILLTATEDVSLVGVTWVESEWQANLQAERVEKLRQKNNQKATEYLDKVGNSLSGSGLTVKTVIKEQKGLQHPADVVLDYAEKNQVDLIVISTHGRSGVTRWAFGSEADRIVRSSRVPVLSITPAGCRV